MAKENIILTRLDNDYTAKLRKKVKKEGMTLSLYVRRLIMRDVDSVIKVKIK